VSWSKRPTWLSVTCFLEALLVAASAFIAWRSHTSPPSEMATCTMIALTGLALGIRNGTVHRLRVPDVTTTVLTLTIAGLAFDSPLGGGTGARWNIRVISILCLSAGAFIGATLLRHSLTLVLSVAAVLSFGTAIVHVFRDETAHEAKLNQR
jgi:uncharacterized membrane protein YoaK (UPF0700 family)